MGDAPTAPRPAYERGRRLSASLLLSLLSCAPVLTGCQRELDMAKDYDDRNAATTIRYTGVREENRLYPDYGVIRSTILAPASSSVAGAKPRGSKGP
jgi:hypothetical protein